jgi:beta-lactam-binding protein with PASTA domain
LIEMPLILGMQQGRAEALLDSLGLDRGETETRFMFGLDQGRVVEQEPAAGTMVEPGSEVKVVAGRRGRGGGNK